MGNMHEVPKADINMQPQFLMRKDYCYLRTCETIVNRRALFS